MSATQPAIEVRGLRQSYGTHVVLDGIDLEVAEGTVFALLRAEQHRQDDHCPDPGDAHSRQFGPSPRRRSRRDQGAGRSTSRDRRHGTGVRGRRTLHRRREPAPDGQLASPWRRRSLGPRQRPAGPVRSERLRRQAGLDIFERHAQAADMAMTLMGDPRIIFLDEPTTGLDPRSRRTMWQIVRELVARGVTILLTTQYLEEADRLASRIALLDEGKIIAHGTPSELKQLVSGGSVRAPVPRRARARSRSRGAGRNTR